VTRFGGGKECHTLQATDCLTRMEFVASRPGLHCVHAGDGVRNLTILAQEF
jgi:hypothetical protein